MLHYTYNRFDDLKSRRDRCDCAPTEEDAKRCFILPFDRMVSPGAASRVNGILPGLRVVCFIPALGSAACGIGRPQGFASLGSVPC